ncbi:MAG: AraC family transcriptional regulator [Gammaproteobacteria bacterium]|nr:AraC family transcriptional regulator [Gammaproteobacteria bacterium]
MPLFYRSDSKGSQVNKANAKAAYAARMNRVLEYIQWHLDEDLSVDALSEVACFSRFHFQRQFAEFVGVSVARYVQLLKLRRASYALAFDQARRITDIALEAGFGNAESFSRAFKKALGQTPSGFRTRPEWQAWNERMPVPNNKRTHPMKVEIVDFPEMQVAVFEHHGSPNTLMTSVQKFIAWRKESACSPVATSKTLGIPYSDPEQTPESDFRFDICGEVSAPVPENAHGVINKTIPAGRCAVVRHIGSTDRIADSIHPLFRDWLPGSGEELRDFPLFFHYIERVPQVEEHRQVTDIYLPLK